MRISDWSSDVCSSDLLLDRFAELILLEEEAGRWARFIMREQADPTRAFEILYGSVMKRVLGLVAALVGRLTGSPADEESQTARALHLVGPVLARKHGV